MNEKLEEQQDPSEEQTADDVDSDAQPDEMVEVSRSQWEDIQNERDELYDKYMRKMADLQNLRKRKEQEKEDYLKYAHKEMANDLVEVIDNFERALDNMEFENESTREGIQLIRQQLLDLLEKHHVESMDAQGDRFDPHRHEAMAQEEREDLDHEKVVEVFREGYTLHDRVLRPAGVRVGVPAQKSPSEPEDEMEQTEESTPSSETSSDGE